MQEYSRNCPQCDKKLTYISEYNRDCAEKDKKLCCSCSQKLAKLKPNKFVKNCPQCNKEMFYKTEKSFNNSIINNKICRSCLTSGCNNPMYGKNRSNQNNPMYGKTVYEAWLEKYDVETADQKYLQWRDSLNKRKNKGKDNPNYGGKYSKFEQAKEWVENNLKGKTLEDVHGMEKAKLIKEK